MDPLSVVGGIVAGGLSYLGGSNANDANRAEAKRNRQFQERMSNTTYQRAVQDMKLAGLNPLLAYGQGGASSPSGSTATVQDAISPAVSNAKQGSRVAGEVQLLRKQIELTDAQRAKAEAEETGTTYANNKFLQTSEQQLRTVNANATEAEQRAENVRLNNEILRLALPRHRATGRFMQDAGNIYDALQTGARWANDKLDPVDLGQRMRDRALAEDRRTTRRFEYITPGRPR